MHTRRKGHGDASRFAKSKNVEEPQGMMMTKTDMIIFMSQCTVVNIIICT